MVYEPAFKEDTFFGSNVINNLDVFKRNSDIVIANRIDQDISDIKEKVYTRDLFNRD